MNWKILSSEYLFKDLWFKVRKDKCETPKGKIVDPYYVYEFPTWVTALALTEDGRVVLEKQYRHALGTVCTEVPGGCVDDTDISLQAAIERELLEETGYRFSTYEYLGKISANPSTNNNLMHMFLATGGRKVAAQELDHNEEIAIELVTVDELIALVKDNQIIQAMHLACIYYGLSRLGRLAY